MVPHGRAKFEREGMCVIYFYSATGNSLTAARLLAEQLDNATVVSIPGALEQDDPYAAARKTDKVGFVFPVHRATLPPIVKKFVAGLPVDPDTYYFALATCSIVGCNEFWELDQLLSLKGAMLNYSSELSFVGGVGTITPSEQAVENNIKRAETQIPAIAEKINNREENDPTNSYSKLLNTVVGRFNSTFRKHPKFRVDNSCTSCGICAQVCPVDNIVLDENGTPIRSDKCEGCYACVHWCPTHSVRSFFHFPNRYHNPRVTPDDLKQGTAVHEGSTMRSIPPASQS